jgi:hypothetical protein
MTDARALLRDHWKAPTIAAAASLGLADRLDGPRQAEDLASDLGAHPLATYRLLRALAALGLVEHRNDGSFALTDAGTVLRTDDPASVRGMARHVGGMLLPAFLQLDTCVRTGAPPPDILSGPDGFAALVDNPTEAHIFNQSMVDNSRRIAGRAIEAYDFSRFAHVMDVGGGYGAVIATLLQRRPTLRGSILDMAHAREGALAYLEREGVADRAEFIEGSFFEAIPAGPDCYLLKYILHDWDDAHAERIVVRLGETARAGEATVILIERILPDRFEQDGEHQGAAAADLTMMLWNGRERTRSEFESLLACGGLRLTRAVPIGEAHYVIEAEPV